MAKTITRSLIGLTFILAAAFWWLMLSGATAPKSAPELFDIDDWRSMVAARQGDKPQTIRVLELSRGDVPTFAVQAGWFGGTTQMAFTAFEIEYKDYSIIVGGAVDLDTSVEMAVPEDAFNHETYERLLASLITADQVVITHEHLDHVMAIARHPEPEMIAPNLVMNEAQIKALPQFITGETPPALANLAPRLDGETRAIAPGVVVAAAPGHTAGSQVVFVSLKNGHEYLLIGDIAWAMKNIEDLKTRPKLTQWVVFDPNEERGNVRRQLRALHDLMDAEPDLHVVTSHDIAHIDSMVAAGALKAGFTEKK